MIWQLFLKVFVKVEKLSDIKPPLNSKYNVPWIDFQCRQPQLRQLRPLWMRPCPNWPSTRWTSSWKPCFFSHAASAPVQMATTTAVKAVFFVTFLISLNQPLEPSQVPASRPCSRRSSHYGLWKVNNLVSSFHPIFIICTYILRSGAIRGWLHCPKMKMNGIKLSQLQFHFPGLQGTHMLEQETFLFL